ncbi:hypothetical protein [Saccharopolyspora sp. NPDC050642]|uniref:hypothetical protein n=1 Tax=Saccharopolyspora sp. NPDC050642 TaxID=3157099 RepID=UPI0033F413B0
MRTTTHRGSRLGRVAAAVTLAATSLLALPLSATAEGAADVPDIQWPPAGTTPPNYPPEEMDKHATALQQRMEAVFPAAVPHAADPVTPKPQQLSDTQFLHGTTVFRDSIGRTGVTMQYNAPGVVQKSPKESCENPGGTPVTFCEGRLLEDGSVLVHLRFESDGHVVASAYHYMLDGSVTMVSSYNYDPIIDDQQDPTTRPEVAVPYEQLDVLAADPELALH